MSTLSIELPTIGLPDKTQDPKINTAFTTIQTWANGNVGTVNLESGLLAGTWESTTLGAKVEEDSGTYQTIRCRKEAGGAVVRLRGVALIKVGETLTAGETLMTLPSGLRPSTNVLGALMAGAGAKTISNFNIASSGVMTISATLTASQLVALDSITFNIT